jgi:hypothetical protein
MRKVLLLAGIIIIMGLTNIFAQAPNTIMYQGRLTNPDGGPLTDRDVDSVHFYIETGGLIPFVLYDTTVTDLNIDNNGVFTVELGPIPGTVFSGSKRYLSLKVNNDPLMSPKQPLTSAPYAMNVAGMPGIAHSFDYGGSSINNTNQATDTVTINAPIAGYVVVQVTGWFEGTHPGDGANRYMRACIHTVPNVNDFTNFNYLTLDYTYAVEFDIPFSIAGVYTVSAGNYTYYLNSDCDAGLTSSYIRRTHFMATFYPANYGTVDKGEASPNIPTNSLNGVID